MARRGSESFQKRARERARQEKQAEKREKRRAGSSDDDGPSRASEDALMEEFALLSARFEADQVSTERYNEERQRIFDELGLEPDD